MLVRRRPLPVSARTRLRNTTVAMTAAAATFESGWPASLPAVMRWKVASQNST
jgi:hypothetical protein